MENNIKVKTCWDITIQEKIINSVSVKYLKAEQTVIDDEERSWLFLD